MQKAKISKPNPEALTERGLHQIMLKLDIPSRQPLLVNWGLLSLTFITNYLLWRFVNLRTAFVAGITFVSTVLIDLVLLRQLPKRRISYGPIGSQLLIMLLPRIGVSALSLLFSFWKSTIGLAMMIALQLMGTISYLWGMAFEPHRLNLTHLTIKSPHLPKNAPPIRILHISDIHLERLTKREDKILELIETAQPELIIITGDYLNLSYTKDPISIEQVRGLLSKIHATYGVYAILGSPPVDVAGVASQHFDDSHVRLLRHDMIEVDLGEGRNLTLLGMDCSHDMPYDEQQFEMLIAQKTQVSGMKWDDMMKTGQHCMSVAVLVWKG